MTDPEFHCRACDELFPRAVWHCRECGHHHGPERAQCANCHRPRARSPLARPLTAADAEMFLVYWMLRHAGPDDVGRLAQYAKAARPAQLGKRVVKQVLFLADRERESRGDAGLSPEWPPLRRVSG